MKIEALTNLESEIDPLGFRASPPDRQGLKELLNYARVWNATTRRPVTTKTGQLYNHTKKCLIAYIYCFIGLKISLWACPDNVSLAVRFYWVTNPLRSGTSSNSIIILTNPSGTLVCVFGLGFRVLSSGF
jgi:hypothetical protein